MGNTWRGIAGLLAGRRVPLIVKLAYTAFVCVMVPFYWNAYGPTNFLYFCDVAVFLTLVAVWTEKSLPASMAAVGIVLPQMLWVVDFLAMMFGGHVTDMTAYMFNPTIPLFARGLSLFHGWLPFLLLYLVWRLGYDRRALAAWLVPAWALMLVAYFLMPPPPGPAVVRDRATLAVNAWSSVAQQQCRQSIAGGPGPYVLAVAEFLSTPPPPADDRNLPVNIDYVYGLSDDDPQTWMPPLAWLAVMMAGLPVLFFIPTHFLLRYLVPPPGAAASTGQWEVIGHDAFAGEWYPVASGLPNEEAARAVARKYLAEMERARAAGSSGGQDGTRDRVSIVAPDGKHVHFRG